MRFADAVVPTEWAAETIVYADFAGDPAPNAPLTWAQQVMWRAATLSRSHHLFMNLRRTLPVSSRVRSDPASVSRAVGALVSRHSGLRTRVRDVDGTPRQEPAAHGRLPLLLVPGEQDGTAAAATLATRLGAVAFDHAGEWPLRVGLVVVDDRVRQIVLVFSHSTVDAYAVDVVLRDLRLLLLRGALTTPAGPQSVNVALRQAGPDRHRSDRAVDHWVRQMKRLPEPAMVTVGPGLEPLLRRGVLVSAAVGEAARLVAARHGVSGSAVLAAGMTALAAGAQGRTAVGLFNMAHNRFRPEYASAVANLGQISCSAVDISDRPDFGVLLPRLWQASLDGYRHAYYDPKALRERFTELGYDYGTAFTPYYYFNDVRLLDPTADRSPAVSEAELREVAGRSAFSWGEGLDRASWHLLLHAVDQPGAVGLTLTVDTRFVSLDRVEPFLRAYEDLLITAAFRDVPWPWSPG